MYTTDDSASSQPGYTKALLNINGLKNLRVFWFTYAGGPSGFCSQTFNFTQNSHIIVNPDSGDCSIQNY